MYYYMINKKKKTSIQNTTSKGESECTITENWVRKQNNGMEKYKQEQAKIDQGSHGFNVKESLWTLQKKDKNALDKKERIDGLVVLG